MKKILFLAFLMATSALASTSNTITLFVNPAQKNINFKSPSTTFFSFGKSYAKVILGEKLLKFHKGGMGHAVAKVNCADTKGVNHSFFAGLSGQYSIEQDKFDLLEDKQGLGVLFNEYADGYIQASSYVRLLVGDHRGRLIRDGRGVIKRMKPKFMSFKITPESCERAVDYYETFKAKRFLEPPTREEYLVMAPNEPLFFSFMHDPYEIYLDIKENQTPIEHARMGGGCSSFAVGFLKAAGVFDPIFEKLWRVKLDVGESFIGGRDTGKEVPVKKVIFSSKWSKPGDEIRSVSFYHPENIWAFFERAEDCKNGHLESRFCTIEIKKWLAAKNQKIKATSQKIKYTLERKRKGEVKKERILPGLEVSL